MPRTASVRIEYIRRIRLEFGTDHDPRSTTSVCAFGQLQEDWDVRDTGGEVRQSSCVLYCTRVNQEALTAKIPDRRPKNSSQLGSKSNKGPRMPI